MKTLKAGTKLLTIEGILFATLLYDVSIQDELDHNQFAFTEYAEQSQSPATEFITAIQVAFNAKQEIQ